MRNGVILCIVILWSNVVPAVEIMDSSALGSFPNPPADKVIAYGTDPLQFGELRLPEGSGPHPVMILIHGGVWLAEYDIAHIRKLAAAFAREGIATWAIEYRRVGNPGGGWPGTFDDVAAGMDHLAKIATEFELDLSRLLAAGHSAGGHLAIWLANRPERWSASVNPTAVLGLAPAADLVYLHGGSFGTVVNQLMGGSPEEVPQRYALGSGTARLPLSVPQYLLVGKYDTSWSPVARRYAQSALRAGNTPELIEAPESGHFEMIDPDSSTWPLVLKTARTALEINAPQEEPTP